MSDTRILLKRDESIALHALLYMASHPGASAAEIAERQALPSAFTAKVLHRLAASGIVESRAGRNGGVWLRTSLADLTVLTVVEALSGAVRIDVCHPPCDTPAHCGTGHDVGSDAGEAPCRLHGAYRQLAQRIRAAMSDVRLADMMPAETDDTASL